MSGNLATSESAMDSGALLLNYWIDYRGSCMGPVEQPLLDCIFYASAKVLRGGALGTSHY